MFVDFTGGTCVALLFHPISGLSENHIFSLGGPVPSRYLFILALCLSTAAVKAAPSLYGIELGRPIAEQMPHCVGVVSRTTCWRTSMDPIQEGESGYDIWFSADESPAGIRTPFVVEIDGLVQAIITSTQGEYIQGQLLSDMTKKFGKPSVLRRTTMTNNFGVRHVAIDARWKASGSVAELYGFESDVDYGRLLLMTPAYAETLRLRDLKRESGRRRP